mmetsp:Transcript_38576/g.110822  ORF Transcript_38576/g.110822 Transcript_38576/m.110822 type:complete len:397 (+) Transcript_38576:881-2071(+)
MQGLEPPRVRHVLPTSRRAAVRVIARAAGDDEDAVAEERRAVRVPCVAALLALDVGCDPGICLEVKELDVVAKVAALVAAHHRQVTLRELRPRQARRHIRSGVVRPRRHFAGRHPLAARGPIGREPDLEDAEAVALVLVAAVEVAAGERYSEWLASDATVAPWLLLLEDGDRGLICIVRRRARDPYLREAERQLVHSARVHVCARASAPAAHDEDVPPPGEHPRGALPRAEAVPARDLLPRDRGALLQLEELAVLARGQRLSFAVVVGELLIQEETPSLPIGESACHEGCRGGDGGCFDTAKAAQHRIMNLLAKVSQAEAAPRRRHRLLDPRPRHGHRLLAVLLREQRLLRPRPREAPEEQRRPGEAQARGEAREAGGEDVEEVVEAGEAKHVRAR